MMTILPDLCRSLASVSFRKLSPAEIIALATEADLYGIEWGGDVHTPPGDIALAGQVARQTRDAGLFVPSYGSYYRLGVSSREEGDKVLESAAELGAEIVRVWAGNVGSADASPEFRDTVVRDALSLTERAADQKLSIACEWHGGTLTDTLDSALKLLDAVNHRYFGTYWQPRNGQSVESRLSDINSISPYLMGLHIFHWSEKGERLPLSIGEAVWTPCLRQIARSRNAPLFAHLEFVRNDDPQQMKDDAATLEQWIDKHWRR